MLSDDLRTLLMDFAEAIRPRRVIEILPLADALHAAMADADASIVLGTDYVLVNGEAMKGFREHYLLVKKAYKAVQ